MPKAQDLVCKMEVDVEKAKHKAEYMGKTYYFCSAHCKAAFEKEPNAYVKP